MSVRLLNSVAAMIGALVSPLLGTVRYGASVGIARLGILGQEVRVARSAIRDYEMLLRCGVPGDKAVDDVFISHYAVREPVVPAIGLNPERYAWPASAASVAGPEKAILTAV